MNALINPRDVHVSKGDHGISVHPIWADVDRPDVGGWLVPTAALANRLRAALLAGVAYSKTEFKTDNRGKTYVHGTSRISGRTLNADLLRLGF